MFPTKGNGNLKPGRRGGEECIFAPIITKFSKIRFLIYLWRAPLCRRHREEKHACCVRLVSEGASVARDCRPPGSKKAAFRRRRPRSMSGINQVKRVLWRRSYSPCPSGWKGFVVMHGRHWLLPKPARRHTG